MGNATAINTNESIAVLDGGISEAARQLGLDPRTLYRAAESGEFPAAIRLGRRWIVPLPAWKKFLEGGGRLGGRPDKDA